MALMEHLHTQVAYNTDETDSTSEIHYCSCMQVQLQVNEQVLSATKLPKEPYRHMCWLT